MKKPLLLTIILTLAACSNSNKPNLARLYQLNSSSQSEEVPLILTHGILGSKLRYKNSKLEIWPGNVSKLVFSKYKDLAYDIDDVDIEPLQKNQEAHSIMDTISGFSIYQEIIDTLVQHGGYQLANVSDAYSSGRKLYIFNYDWRQDNVKSAQQLDTFIKKIQSQYPKKYDQKVDIVAHSMGGLITRYYMRYGIKDVLNDNKFEANLGSAKNIRKAVFLGTPNLGLVLSVNRFVNGYKFGLKTIPIEVMITMPSIYQMLPHSFTNWIVDLEGNTIKMDIFNYQTWQKYKWAIYDPLVREVIINNEEDTAVGQQKIKTLELFFEKNLSRSRNFLWALSENLDNYSHDFIMMGGDCAKTPARLVMEYYNEKYLIRTMPSQVVQKYDDINYEQLMLEPGDGHVTKSSLLARVKLDPTAARPESSFFPMKYKIMLCETHRTLTSNITFQDNLLDILLSND
jgi:pimeloyl-ACP methyl ester carboxylesterase